MEREKQTGKTINLHDRERERQTLRSEIAKLLEERDNLLYVRAPHIEAAYCLKFGEAEYKVHELRCDTMRAKRKIELIRASLNRRSRFPRRQSKRDSTGSFTNTKNGSTIG